jgi:hypothetical protein
VITGAESGTVVTVSSVETGAGELVGGGLLIGAGVGAGVSVFSMFACSSVDTGYDEISLPISSYVTSIPPTLAVDGISIAPA